MAATEQDILRLDVDRGQQEEIRQATGRAVETLELSVEELEERIAPGLKNRF